MPNAAGDVPDVNVWLALSHPDHIHHPAAKDYWNRSRGDRTAFFRVTLFGLLRLLTNPNVMEHRLVDPAKAWSICQTYLAMPDVLLLPEAPGIDTRLEAWTRASFFTPKLWTDAWIATLALEHGYRVVSFDADFAKFPDLSFLHLRA